MSETTEYSLLSKVIHPDDLRKLDIEQLPALCKELRNFIWNALSSNPGHLASSLGTIELTVALHYVYNTPYDRIVWDVGHQAYGHKILTGRRQRFASNRKLGGIKPFPSPQESEYDTFACGHASNSISAALGMATAALQLNEPKKKVVAVIGDGAMSGGLAFEGLNNTSDTPNNMLIVLNDNNMSIDRAVGGMKHYLMQLQTSGLYNRIRFKIAQKMMDWGWLDEKRRRSILRFNNSLKSLLTNQQNVFEGMNIRYFGPTDGHDVIALVKALQEIKDMKGPKLLHLHTVKGRGFKAAEKNPTVWHAPGLFDAEDGERLKENTEGKPPRFQDVFGETLLEMAQQNPKIVGVTPAMPTGCSMNIMMKAMPQRTFDVGIAEGHAVTFSAGMAKEGLMPFCNIYSSFAQRAYDNIIHDAALLNLDLVICLDRAGIVGEDGPTHHGAFDLASLRAVPNVTIASPYDEHELRRLMFTAQQPGHGTFVIRYPRGGGRLVNWRCPLESVEVGKGRCLKQGNDIAVLTLGPIGNLAADAIKLFEEKHPDTTVAHYDLRFLKPLDEAMLSEIGSKFKRIITVEDGCLQGGMGSAVLEWFADKGLTPRVIRIGIPDKFIEHGSVPELYKLCRMNTESMVEALEEIK
ncbi:MAG: 1-deoxy-D-xylulose-5-phosphate synthase [Bacteroidaceae bacterium]|nr:1-deoxy-D-xylulose-5-phosphate synthase [Bacteroidaceae bacterium]